MVLYEYPFNENVRTMLRLEQLFDRLSLLIPRDDAVDHHFALASMFEVIEVAARADLKSEMLKDLERHRAQMNAYRGNPSISVAALDGVTAQLDHAFNGLNQMSGKAGHALSNNDWLMSIRSRINIPAGTCEFDLPGYYAWQQRDPSRRRADLMQWLETLAPLAQALRLLLRLLRESGVPRHVVASGGHFQQSLAQGKSYHLLRVRLDDAEELVPEITGHRLMIAVRLMLADADGRLKPIARDGSFELTLCA